MNKQFILGVLLCVLGLVIGWLTSVMYCLCGGIIDLLGFYQSGLTDMSLLTWGVIKVVSATPVGTIVGSVFLVPGWALVESNNIKW